MTGFGHLLQASVSQDMLLGANSLKISGEVSVSWQVLLGFHDGGVGSSSTSHVCLYATSPLVWELSWVHSEWQGGPLGLDGEVSDE